MVFCGYLAIRGVDLREAGTIIGGVKWDYLAGAVALVAFAPWVRAWRWRALFENPVPGYQLLLRAVATGQTLNFVIPLQSGEVARVLMVKGRKLQVAGTIVVERFIEAIFFAALCLILPFIWVVPEWLEGPRVSVVLLAGIYLLGILAISRLSRRFVQLPSLMKIPVLFGSSLFLSASSVLINFLVLRALKISAPFLAAVVLLLILQVGLFVPVTPGKVGMLQYLTVIGLSIFGVGKTAALAYGLVLHLVVFVPVAMLAWILVLVDTD